MNIIGSIGVMFLSLNMMEKDEIMPKINGTYQWASVIQIFRSDQPSANADRKVSKVMKDMLSMCGYYWNITT